MKFHIVLRITACFEVFIKPLPFLSICSRATEIDSDSKCAGHRGFRQQTLIGALCVAGIDALDVIGFVLGHHLIAADAVGDGVHDGPLPGGRLPAAFGFFARQRDDFGAAQVHVQRAFCNIDA